jgi:hypothetical protein
MKKTLFFLIILFLFGCEKYTEVSDPVIYMGGGKWTLINYDIVVINSISLITITKSDTICINSFNELRTTSSGIIMKQTYNKTSISRRFIRNKTQWEFDGYNLYCDWVNTPGGMKPSHEPFWIKYPNYLYTNYTEMSILDNTNGSETNFTFKTNNKGVAPPNELILISPNIIINLYSSNGSRDKAVTFQIVLTFMR